jgi:hypothetical protein
MCAAVLAVLATAFCFGAPLPEPIFSADFEATLDAQGAAGLVQAANVTGTPQYQPGRIGQALFVGDDACRVTYPAEGALYLTEGTISIRSHPARRAEGSRCDQSSYSSWSLPRRSSLC